MRVGQGCTFYHEGGRGDKRWVVGWRFGVVRAIPAKGQHKNWVQIEIPVRAFTWDDAGKVWKRKPNARAWVHSKAVNAVGDYVFHGNENLVAEVEERQAKKEADEVKAAKKAGKSGRGNDKQKRVRASAKSGPKAGRAGGGGRRQLARV
jgi:hypothetical protein